LRDFQNEGYVICAKFGKDLFSISKVIGRKTKWPRFFSLPCTTDWQISSIIIITPPYSEATIHAARRHRKHHPGISHWTCCACRHCWRL